MRRLIRLLFDRLDILKVIAKLSSYIDRLIFNNIFIVLVSPVEFLELLVFMGSVVVSLLFSELY